MRKTVNFLLSLSIFVTAMMLMTKASNEGPAYTNSFEDCKSVAINFDYTFFNMG